ncbi:helix-turn-helix domain-containing protein [Micromonospora sp. PLK6-60]|uniref:helix-turn-helix domain-containing protein n=1 Tax=Micromonospora sp. PLK6-60 TaxID=2873383 RepID=UPI0027DF5469|nr:helix-turn-helix domain-containing protein [Micromonospora sp. PLK6-60]
MTGEGVPIGRRVAYLRVRRKLSQQSCADRLGKSKSWVDKVERGVRPLERVSTIREVAAVLRVDAATLLGPDARPAGAAERTEGVARIRAALSTYGLTPGRDLPPDRLGQAVGHAWSTYRYARYPQLVEQLPALLTDVQHTQTRDRTLDRAAVVDAYRVTAALLTKLDEASLAWLAADRAMTAATGDRTLLACAAVQLGPVLRASARARSVLLAAAYRIGPRDPDSGTPGELSLCGTLLAQAALTAARAGNARAAGELLYEAGEMAARVGDGHDHHRTAFGPAAVNVARVVAAVDLGDGAAAVTGHEKAIQGEGWRWLPLEHRAAHLVDAARAYLMVGDAESAAKVLVRADRLAPAEIRHRPAAGNLVAQVARHADAAALIAPLARALGID